MDFIEGLPKSKGKIIIWVVVDKLTKYSHFMSLSHPYTGTDIAKVFMDQVYKLHGLPEDIISDRNLIFTSKVWQELFSMLGVTLNTSTAYHLQIDGQTEVVNRCLETYLRCFFFQILKRTSLVVYLQLNGGTIPPITLLYRLHLMKHCIGNLLLFTCPML